MLYTAQVWCFWTESSVRCLKVFETWSSFFAATTCTWQHHFRFITATFNHPEGLCLGNPLRQHHATDATTHVLTWKLWKADLETFFGVQSSPQAPSSDKLAKPIWWYIAHTCWLAWLNQLNLPILWGALPNVRKNNSSLSWIHVLLWTHENRHGAAIAFLLTSTISETSQNFKSLPQNVGNTVGLEVHDFEIFWVWISEHDHSTKLNQE